MSTPVPPPAGGKGPAGKLAAAAGGRRNLFIAAAAGTAVLAFVMARMSGGGGGAVDEDGGSNQIMLGYDSGPYDQYNDLQQRIEDLQDQIDDGVVTPGTPTPPAPTPPAPKPTPTPSKPKPTPKPLPKPPPAAAKKYVTIKRGDTLSGIAKKAGISMSSLKKLNPTFWTNPKYKQGNMIWSGGKVRVK